MPAKRKIRRRAKEIRSEIRRAPYVLPIGDGSGYILLVRGTTPRQFETLDEALAARDNVVNCPA
jgi:hypothetical protein